MNKEKYNQLYGKFGCSKFCNDCRQEALFVFINGDEIKHLCESCLKDILLDVVTHNDTLTFYAGDKDSETKQQTIKVT